MTETLGPKAIRGHIADIMADGRERTASDVQLKLRKVGIEMSPSMIAETMGAMCVDRELRSKQRAGLTCWQVPSEPQIKTRAERHPVGTVSRRKEVDPSEWMPKLFKIVEVIASQTGTSATDLLGRDTHWRVSSARAAAMHACWRVGGFNFAQIGEAFQRDSSGVGRAIRQYAYACNAEAAE